jgi:hypothetical protein
MLNTRDGETWFGLGIISKLRDRPALVKDPGVVISTASIKYRGPPEGKELLSAMTLRRFAFGVPDACIPDSSIIRGIESPFVWAELDFRGGVLATFGRTEGGFRSV